jgi:UDP-GlcNAc:undecaprenyl-phosphate GlcNAc-1-phosphate transferase
MYVIFIFGILAFLLSLILTPLIRDAFRRYGIVDQPDNIRKVHMCPVPRVGGIAITVSYAITMAVALLTPQPFGYLIEHDFPDIWKLLIAAGLIFLTGLLDDLIGLKPWQKLCEQLTGALLAYFGGVQIHLFRGSEWDVWFSIPITMIWLVGCTNAFNLIDGLDGLAAGVGLFATLTMVLAALANHNLDLAMVTIPLAGALLAFLRYNFNPASVFLGDSGSLTIGFLLGCYGVIWSHKSATLLGLTAPLMAMSIPLLDAGLSIVRRFLRHQPIFGADRGHIHHRLLDRGLRPRGVALLIYACSGIAAGFSLLLSSQNQFGGLIIVLFCAAMWIGIQNLGYVEFGMARQMLMKGSFTRLIDSHTRLQHLDDSLKKAEGIDECWAIIMDTSRDFGSGAVRMYAGGRLFESGIEEASAAPHWQVRVPLRDDQYINLWFKFPTNGTMNPGVVGGLAEVLQRNLSTTISAAEKPVLVAGNVSRSDEDADSSMPAKALAAINSR